MKDFEGKVAVITGGGSGLGRELALCCARRGMKLVLADVDEPGLTETVRLVEEERPGTQTATCRVDVRLSDEVDGLADFAKSRFGGVHLVFNNAGVSVGGPIWENTASDWEWVLGVNLKGVAWGVKAFVPMMLEQGDGYVVNVASAAGWLYTPGSGIYNTSKAGVVALSETLAMDLKDAGANIGVTVVCPAFFPTPIVDSQRNRPAELADTVPLTDAVKERHERTRQAVERGRISAAEIAEMTMKAVEVDQFYVFPHQKIKGQIRARAEAANAEQAAFDVRQGQ